MRRICRNDRFSSAQCPYARMSTSSEESSSPRLLQPPSQPQRRLYRGHRSPAPHGMHNSATTTTASNSSGAGESSSQPFQHSPAELPPLPGASSSSSSSACAACKYQRRKCQPDCMLAPFFPADQQETFINAHRLFGIRNILSTLKKIDRTLHSEAMRSIIYHANFRAHNPILGCVGFIIHLRCAVAIFQARLKKVHEQLAKYQSLYGTAQTHALTLPNTVLNDHPNVALAADHVVDGADPAAYADLSYVNAIPSDNPSLSGAGAVPTLTFPQQQLLRQQLHQYQLLQEYQQLLTQQTQQQQLLLAQQLVQEQDGQFYAANQYYHNNGDQLPPVGNDAANHYYHNIGDQLPPVGNDAANQYYHNNGDQLPPVGNNAANQYYHNDGDQLPPVGNDAANQYYHNDGDQLPPVGNDAANQYYHNDGDQLPPVGNNAANQYYHNNGDQLPPVGNDAANQYYHNDGDQLPPVGNDAANQYYHNNGDQLPPVGNDAADLGFVGFQGHHEDLHGSIQAPEVFGEDFFDPSDQDTFLESAMEELLNMSSPSFCFDRPEYPDYGELGDGTATSFDVTCHNPSSAM